MKRKTKAKRYRMVGRNAATGQFCSVIYARQHRRTCVVERIGY